MSSMLTKLKSRDFLMVHACACVFWALKFSLSCIQAKRRASSFHFVANCAGALFSFSNRLRI